MSDLVVYFKVIVIKDAVEIVVKLLQILLFSCIRTLQLGNLMFKVDMVQQGCKRKYFWYYLNKENCVLCRRK